MVEEPMNGFVDSLLMCDEQGHANTSEAKLFDVAILLVD